MRFTDTYAVPRMRTAQSNGLRHRLPRQQLPLVAFPGAYSASDSGINFNIDTAAAMTATTYVVPGPSVWPGSDTASGAASAVTTAAGTTTLKMVIVATSVASGSTTGCTIAKYGQCGGMTYTGRTVCCWVSWPSPPPFPRRGEANHCLCCGADPRARQAATTTRNICSASARQSLGCQIVFACICWGRVLNTICISHSLFKSV